MTTILTQLPVERLGWVLIHSLWEFLAIALVVRLIERAFAGRSSASVRYAAGPCGALQEGENLGPDLVDAGGPRGFGHAGNSCIRRAAEEPAGTRCGDPGWAGRHQPALRRSR